MTIEFNCPKCNSVIAFADKHAGKSAHCVTCNQKFFIPDKSFDKVKTIKPPKEIMSDPIPGFYRAALIDNWKLFFNFKNYAGIISLLIAAIFYYFTGNTNSTTNIVTQGGGTITIFLPFGWLFTGLSWGFIFFYYREIIYTIGYDQDDFPPVNLEGFYSFMWKVITSVYMLFIIFIVVGLPSIILYTIFENVLLENHIVSLLLFSFGLFLFPVAIMNIAAAKDIAVLRPDYLIKQVYRDFIPYMIIYIYLSSAIFMLFVAKQFSPIEPSQISIGLILHIISQLIFIFAIRAIGLFYRHYSCHVPW